MQQRQIERGQHSAARGSWRTSALLTGLLLVGAPATASEGSARSGGTEDLTGPLMALEERAYAAWKAGDTAWWGDVLTESFVGWGAAGRVGKAAAIPLLGGADCRISAYRLTDPRVTLLAPNAALLTHRTEVDGACHGRPVAPVARTLTVYVREGGQWKIGYRARSAVVDPMKATPPPDSGVWTSGPTASDAATQTLLARERAVVNAWKDRDGSRMAELFGPTLQFVDIFGNHIATRAEALKAWSGEGCDVKSFELEGAKATMFSPDVGVLTYRAVYDAKCFGQDVWPIWGSAFYVRHGDAWLWSSGINVLAGAAVP
jgi:hypothetical protein